MAEWEVFPQSSLQKQWKTTILGAKYYWEMYNTVSDEHKMSKIALEQLRRAVSFYPCQLLSQASTAQCHKRSMWLMACLLTLSIYPIFPVFSGTSQVQVLCSLVQQCETTGIVECPGAVKKKYWGFLINRLGSEKVKEGSQPWDLFCRRKRAKGSLHPACRQCNPLPYEKGDRWLPAGCEALWDWEKVHNCEISPSVELEKSGACTQYSTFQALPQSKQSGCWMSTSTWLGKGSKLWGSSLRRKE